MKNRQQFSSFPQQRVRRGMPPFLIPAILVLLLIGLLAWFWARGGESEQQRVEKPVPAERLGK